MNLLRQSQKKSPAAPRGRPPRSIRPRSSVHNAAAKPGARGRQRPGARQPAPGKRTHAPRSLRRGGSLLLVLRALPLLPVVVLVRPGRAERALRAEGLLLGRRLRQRDDLLERVLRDVLRLGPRGVALL